MTDDQKAVAEAKAVAHLAKHAAQPAETALNGFGVVSAADEPLTEAGAAERFARLHGNDLRFDHRRQRWLVWQGHRWAPDADAAVTRITLEFSRNWQLEAAGLPDAKSRKAAFDFAIALEKRDRLTSLLAFARDLRPIADAGDRWDANHWLLGVPNGVVDLRTGVLRDGRRDDRITLSTTLAYDPTATCPQWEQFLVEVFNGNADLVAFVRRAIGYSLTGDTGEQCLFFCYGAGSNGKGTLLNTLRHVVLGDYGHALPFSALEHDPRPGAASNELAALLGRRFVVSSEASESRRFDEGRVKWITGSDPIRARFLYCESFEFIPAAKFWLAANHKPVVRDDSYGFWRRIRLIPFARIFDVDATLAGRLAAEAPGILAWCVRGCLDWQQHGLSTPNAVLQATAEYQRDSDALGPFEQEALDLTDPHAEVRAAPLYDHYRRWADLHRLSERERLTATAFGRKASERFEHVRTETGKVYRGLALRPIGQSPEGTP